MDNTLGRIANLFRHRWDPQIVSALNGPPLRFSALSWLLQTQAGEHLDDSTLTRSLQRLIRAGLVTVDRQPIAGRTTNVYQLTEQGRAQLATYQSFIAAYEHLSDHNSHDSQHPNGGVSQQPSDPVTPNEQRIA